MNSYIIDQDRYDEWPEDRWNADYPPETAEDVCSYESGHFCMISVALLEEHWMTDRWWKKIWNRFSKSRQQRLKEFAEIIGLLGTEECSICCPFRPRNLTPWKQEELDKTSS